ncbi:hypothetical protein A3Q56_05281 [Intoshia linei]|uniref:Uncharacterized protein n=1 Tax=Intoshia linei TaxID=1819745 RepID=A0A177AY77_9BILA|nr:hypothetical protein A3Q56_05281 [Intoshia linei]
MIGGKCLQAKPNKKNNDIQFSILSKDKRKLLKNANNSKFDQEIFEFKKRGIKCYDSELILSAILSHKVEWNVYLM